MMSTTSSKVTSDHLRRHAYLYVRQSSLQQVHDHRESTARQYDLKRRASALGWSTEQIVVIDEDLGLSGASAVERSGFQRLVAEVSFVPTWDETLDSKALWRRTLVITRDCLASRLSAPPCEAHARGFLSRVIASGCSGCSFAPRPFTKCQPL